MTNQINTTMTFQEYRDAPGINIHSLMDFARCPAWYKHKKDFPCEKVTDAMLLGSAVDMQVFEPEKWETEFAVLPELNLRTNAGKEAKAEFEAANVGKRIITQDMYEQALSMALKVRLDNRASNLLHGCQYQASLFFNGLKGRPDAMKLGQMADLKTTQDASPEEFRRSIFKYNYHNQAAWYVALARSLGLPIETYHIIAIEKTEPYLVGIYRLGRNLLQRGLEENSHQLARLRECEMLDHYPAYEVQEIEID